MVTKSGFLAPNFFYVPNCLAETKQPTICPTSVTSAGNHITHANFESCLPLI